MIAGTQVTVPVTFTSGTTSTPADVGGLALTGIEIPASLASTSMTFEASSDGGATFVPVRDRFGTAITVTTTSTAGVYNFRDGLIFGLKDVRLTAGSSETSKTIKLLCQRIV